MKKMIAVALWFAGVLLLCSPGEHVQAKSSEQASTDLSKDDQASIDQSVAMIRKDLRANKKQTIAASLQLTEAEAAKFWPLYDRYTTELSKLGISGMT